MRKLKSSIVKRNRRSTNNMTNLAVILAHASPLLGVRQPSVIDTVGCDIQPRRLAVLVFVDLEAALPRHVREKLTEMDDQLRYCAVPVNHAAGLRTQIRVEELFGRPAAKTQGDSGSRRRIVRSECAVLLRGCWGHGARIGANRGQRPSKPLPSRVESCA